jgi:SM-20-related protein
MIVVPLSEAQIVDIADALAARGWVALDNAIPAAQIDAFRARISSLEGEGGLRQASIGREKSVKTAPQVRSDATFWLEEASADVCDQALLTWLDELRRALNAQLFLGADAIEAHYARYPSGGRYAKHLDRHRDSDARVLSLVLYLNESWQSAWGGQLKLYDACGQLLATMEPEGGRLVLFRSEQFPHEVVPALRPRMSVAAWFRRRP